MKKSALKLDRKVWRFDEMATNVNVRIDNPSESGMEHYVGLEHLDTDSLKIRRWGTPDDVEATKLMFKKGDIIFGRRRAYQRKVGVAEFDGICSAHAMVLRAKPDVVLPEFLPFFMQSDLFMNRAVEISVGSLSPTINWKTMAVQEFALPSIEEQTTIVDTLLAARSVPDAQADALIRLQSLRQSTIDHLLPLTENEASVRLETVATMQNGRPFAGEEYADKGIKLLRPGNLDSSGYLTWLSEKTVYLDSAWETTAADFAIQSGDVVINLTAQSLEDGFMGRVCLARRQDKSLLNQRIGRFRCREDVLRPEYLFRCLQTSRFRQHAHANCEGSKVKHMFWQHLAKYEIAVPDISVQDDVISQCAAIDQAIESLSSRISLSKQLAARLTNQFAGVVDHGL
ncbi:MAG: restriction endonuclease subunit S [Parvibaculum sp.]|nr:restriction endonuclease subunit S [Parvibaculum sp.]